MTPEERDNELIEKYISRQLTDDDERELRERMKDSAFASELKFQSAVAESVNKVYENKLRDQLRQELTHGGSDGHQANIRYFHNSYIYWAAAVSLIVVAVVTLYFLSNQETTDSIFLSFYKPYPATSITRSLESAPDRAFQLYASGDYERASVLLEEMRTDSVHAHDPFLNLLLGNCYLNLNDFAKAYERLDEVRTSGEEVLGQQADWYYALALLKEGRKDESMELLISIRSAHAIYSGQADKLIEQLK